LAQTRPVCAVNRNLTGNSTILVSRLGKPRIHGVGLGGGLVVLVVGVEVGVVVVVGVDVGVVVGVDVGEFCAAVGWVWARLDVAVLGDTVGELDLPGCEDADAETFECGDGPVVPGCWLPCELRAVAAEADAAMMMTAAAAAIQASRRRFLCCGAPAALLSTPPKSAAVPRCV
jgi:hypothetical protein